LTTAPTLKHYLRSCVRCERDDEGGPIAKPRAARATRPISSSSRCIRQAPPAGILVAQCENCGVPIGAVSSSPISRAVTELRLEVDALRRAIGIG